MKNPPQSDPTDEPERPSERMGGVGCTSQSTAGPSVWDVLEQEFRVMRINTERRYNLDLYIAEYMKGGSVAVVNDGKGYRATPVIWVDRTQKRIITGPFRRTYEWKDVVTFYYDGEGWRSDVESFRKQYKMYGYAFLSMAMDTYRENHGRNPSYRGFPLADYMAAIAATSMVDREHVIMTTW